MGNLLALILYYTVGLVCLGAWATHILYCFAMGMWGFLIAGALFFPIGIFHGFFVWFF